MLLAANKNGSVLNSNIFARGEIRTGRTRGVSVVAAVDPLFASLGFFFLNFLIELYLPRRKREKKENVLCVHSGSE